MNDTIFGKEGTWKRAFLFSLPILTETFPIRQSIQRSIITNVQKSPRKVPITPVIFWSNLNFLSSFPKTYQTITVHENPSGWSRVVPCGQMDVTKLTVAFYNSGKAPRNVSLTFILYYTLCVKKIKVLEKTKKTQNHIMKIPNKPCKCAKFGYLAKALKTELQAWRN